MCSLLYENLCQNWLSVKNITIMTFTLMSIDMNFIICLIIQNFRGKYELFTGI